MVVELEAGPLIFLPDLVFRSAEEGQSIWFRKEREGLESVDCPGFESLFILRSISWSAEYLRREFIKHLYQYVPILAGKRGSPGTVEFRVVIIRGLIRKKTGYFGRRFLKVVDSQVQQVNPHSLENCAY